MDPWTGKWVEGLIEFENRKIFWASRPLTDQLTSQLFIFNERIKRMRAVELPKELHHLIDKADDDLLEVIHSIMTPKSIQGFQLSQKQMDIIDPVLFFASLWWLFF
ncbi:MAG: hypothetical protein ABJG41_12975 [Cyclobacteriaceae bacterium]